MKFKFSMQTTLIVIAVLFILVLLLGLLTKKTKNNYNSHPTYLNYNVFENFNPDELEQFSTNPKFKIVLVHAEWCPYCKEYLNEKAANSSKNVFDTAANIVDNIVFEKLDASESDESQSIANSYGVQGYPSIIAVKFDETKDKYVKVATFEEDRNDVNALVKFAKSYNS